MIESGPWVWSLDVLPPLPSLPVQLLQLRVGQLLGQHRDEQFGGRRENHAAEDSSTCVGVVIGALGGVERRHGGGGSHREVSAKNLELFSLRASL